MYFYGILTYLRYAQYLNILNIMIMEMPASSFKKKFASYYENQVKQGCADFKRLRTDQTTIFSFLFVSLPNNVWYTIPYSHMVECFHILYFFKPSMWIRLVNSLLSTLKFQEIKVRTGLLLFLIPDYRTSFVNVWIYEYVVFMYYTM